MLDFGPDPANGGPECSICCERFLALFANPACGHAACEDCWATWAEAQVPRCRVEKQAALRCLGPRCREVAPEAIWLHSSTRNEEVRRLERLLAFRRRLKANRLYPPEVQVECPRQGCLGLAYQGHDKLMCFVCEHQWASDWVGEVSPQDTNLEVMVGEIMKKCPACNEYIIKNGGCDHMTCRCRHEFWWSTLLPYHASPAGNQR